MNAGDSRKPMTIARHIAELQSASNAAGAHSWVVIEHWVRVGKYAQVMEWMKTRVFSKEFPSELRMLAESVEEYGDSETERRG